VNNSDDATLQESILYKKFEGIKFEFAHFPEKNQYYQVEVGPNWTWMLLLKWISGSYSTNYSYYQSLKYSIDKLGKEAKDSGKMCQVLKDGELMPIKYWSKYSD